jgi:hypothetical protein
VRRWPTRPASRSRRWRRPAARSSRWAGCVQLWVVEIVAVDRVVEERLAVEVVEAGEGGCAGCGGGVRWWSGVVEWRAARLDALATPSPPLALRCSRGTPDLPARLTALHARVLAGGQANRQGQAQGGHTRRLPSHERRAPHPPRGADEPLRLAARLAAGARARARPGRSRAGAASPRAGTGAGARGTGARGARARARARACGGGACGGAVCGRADEAGQGA